ncbi:MAG: CRTAC1 family protein [Gammaproteobacteria bacterium]
MPLTKRPLYSVLGCCALIAGCGAGTEHGETGTALRPDQIPVSWFTEISAMAGIDFVHESGPAGLYLLPEIMGSGNALFDYDLDGDLDLFLVTSGPDSREASTGEPGHRLYQQNPDGSFSDRSEAAGIQRKGYGMGATVGDIDNDGDLDLFITNFGPDTLYRNNGDGTFTDITGPAGTGGNTWSTSAVFFDYDLDGLLDLFVATYVRFRRPQSCSNSQGRIEFCGPKAFEGDPDVLYHNDGNGKFSDVSKSSGIYVIASKGLGVIAGDFNDDLWPDLLVANDGEKNQLWINQGDGRFIDQAVVMGTAVNLFGKPEAGMGIAPGDVDGDLRVDVLMTHLSEETNTLYMSLDTQGMQDMTAKSGLGPESMAHTGFGTAFFDADQDADLDLIVINGRVSRALQTNPDSAGNRSDMTHYAERDQLYLNDGTGHFERRCDLASELCGPLRVSRGLSVGDIDNDGDIDVLVTDSNAPARLYRNDTPNQGHWLKVRALDPRFNRDAVGAKIFVSTSSGTQVRSVRHSYSYLSSSDATVHFGLAEASKVDSIHVRWPDGLVESFPGQTADRSIELLRGEGQEPSAESRGRSWR